MSLYSVGIQGLCVISVRSNSHYTSISCVTQKMMVTYFLEIFLWVAGVRPWAALSGPAVACFRSSP